MFDFGHLIIGLDARRKRMSRSWHFSEGGTGLELVTWLGDLGGGAAMLAKDRIAAPAAPALKRMSGSDYGGAINIEGDVAAYVVAHDEGKLDAPSEPIFPTGRVADAIEDYIDVKKPLWKNRAGLFLRMIGGQLAPPGLANRDEIITKIADQIETFGAVYLISRLKDQAKLQPATLHQAAVLIGGAAREIATLFVDALVYSHSNGGATIDAHHVPPPAVSPPGKPNRLLESAGDGADVAKEVRDFFHHLAE
jgi:hypothetical protein